MPIIIKDRAARMKICNDCPSYRKKLKQCKECGCIMPLKTRMQGARCPLGKW